jgi:hypothetical protein
MADYDMSDYAVATDNAGVTVAVMSAPGRSESVKMPGCLDTTVFYKVESIDTNVVVTIEGSDDDTNWVELKNRATKTANGTYLFHYEPRINYMRFYWVSEAGGSAATITVTFSPGVRS